MVPPLKIGPLPGIAGGGGGRVGAFAAGSLVAGAGALLVVVVAAGALVSAVAGLLLVVVSLVGCTAEPPDVVVLLELVLALVVVDATGCGDTLDDVGDDVEVGLATGVESLAGSTNRTWTGSSLGRLIAYAVPAAPVATAAARIGTATRVGTRMIGLPLLVVGRVQR